MPDNFLIIAGFLFLIVTIIFGLHFIFYISCVRFFEIKKKFIRLILLIFIMSLPVIFIVSSIFYRWKEYFLINLAYIFSSLWLGFFANLFLAVVAIWILLIIGNKSRLRVNLKIFAIFFFSIALIISLYGIWNAHNPRPVFVTVKISNLPKHWKNKTIVHLSDVHLGPVRNTNFAQKVANKVNEINPDMILISGDLFDGMDRSLRAPLKIFSEMRAEKGIYFVSGNHENYVGIDIVASLLKETRINFLQNTVIDVDGLKIIGISYPKRGEEKNVVAILESMKNEFWGKPNILLYHSPLNIHEFKNAGVNLQLSGHTHKGQIFPFNFITKLVYKGYDAGLYELEDYTLYTSVGIGTWGPPMRTGNRPEVVVIKIQ